MSEEDWHFVVDVNLTQAYVGCHVFGPHLLEQRRGVVINVSGAAQIRPTAMGAAYGAAKAGVGNFTTSLALEWAPYNVRVNAIAPGTFPDPEQTDAATLAEREATQSKALPIKRLGRLRECGLLAASDAAATSPARLADDGGGRTLWCSSADSERKTHASNELMRLSVAHPLTNHTLPVDDREALSHKTGAFMPCHRDSSSALHGLLPPGEHPTLALERDLELIQWLDYLGYDEAWVGEHHSGGWETIGSPEVFLAVAAERTKHIKLGSGVVSLPYHHPYMVAERAVLLDHLTRGRFMLGIGPGALPFDAKQLGIPMDRIRPSMEKASASSSACLRK